MSPLSTARVCALRSLLLAIERFCSLHALLMFIPGRAFGDSRSGLSTPFEVMSKNILSVTNYCGHYSVMLVCHIAVY